MSDIRIKDNSSASEGQNRTLLLRLNVHGVIVEFGVRWGRNLATLESFLALTLVGNSPMSRSGYLLLR